MFAHDTNLFYSDQDKLFFSTINVDLEKIKQWFHVNKLSLNKT